MNSEQIDKIKESIKNLRDKNSRIYFFVHDTKGNAKASIKFIYDCAITLKKEGYNTFILHEKIDYAGVASWLGEEYMNEVPHQVIEGENIQVSPEDFLVVPEVFGFMMEQVKNLPCGKIVLCQAYDHILETLSPGGTWEQYGFFKCITTSEEQKDYINTLMRHVSVDIIEPTLHENFEASKFPAKTLIGVSAREQREGLNIIKQFYLKYPQYRFFTFKDLRGLSQDDFAKGLQDCLLGVWIDPTSGFGTFPLECMKSGVPVVGKIPNLKPGWMSEKNGIWIDNQNQMVDVIADVVQTWLEDNVLQDLYTEGFNTAEKFTNQENFKTSVVDIFNSFINKRKDAFEAQITQETA